MKKAQGNGAELKSLIKGVNLLKLFTSGKDEWSTKEIVEGLGYHPSSVQRLITNLEAVGFLEKTRSTKEGYYYGLGLQLFLLAKVASQNSILVRAARPWLEWLVEKTQETAHFCIIEDDECYYLDKIDSPRSIRMVTHAGQRLPLYCTGVGKALMSGLSREEVERVAAERGLKPVTSNTITSLERLHDEMALIRREGLAYDNEEMEIGLRCLAAPILDNKGIVIAAISVSGPSQRFTDERLPVFGAWVREAAAEVSRLLGYGEKK